MSAVSPKPKSKPRGSFTRMGADLVCAASRAASKVDIRLMHLLDRARNIAGRRPRPRAGEKRRGNAARLLCKGRRETTMPPRRPSGRLGETHETWLFHDAGASPGKALRRDAQGGSGRLHSRRSARIQRRLLRRAPHRRGREHSQQHDAYRHAAGRDLADESRDRRGQPPAQPSRGRGLKRGDARQSVRRPVHLGHRRRHPSLRRRGARTSRCRPQRHVRGSDRPHPRAVGRDGADRSQGKILDHFTVRTLWPEVGIGDIVKPYQKPHPPIAGTATDPDSKGLIALGRRGWWPISSHFLHPNCLKSQWANYAQCCAEGGHKPERANWRVARSIFVAEDDKVARSYGGDDSNSPYRFYMSQLTAKLKKARRMIAFKPHPDMPDEDVTFDYIFDNVVIRGSVNRVVDRILELHDQVGDFGTLLYCGKDWADPQLGRKSMELMAEKVMPAVNAALARSMAAE